MLLARLQRSSWQLTCLLLASAASATISPSNSSTVSSQFSGFLPLQHTDSGNAQIALLVPMTREAAQRTIEGNLYNTNFSSAGNISNGEIAYISCNPSDYSGYDSAQRVFEQAYENANISGVILYSTETNYCSYIQDSGNTVMQNFPIYSMANKTESAAVHNAIANLPVHMKYFVQVASRGSSGTTSTNNNNNSQSAQQNPLGPSPSTAVAMIILYTITGVITALFLVIIVTGAVRAHRHPERYGPRNVMGRPRQSRARGLGRAILDTIPIVKFGEKEAPKPTDMESGSSDARDIAGANTDTALPTHTAATEGTEMHDVTSKPTTVVADIPKDTSTAPVEEHQEGIAPAQPVTAAVLAGTDNTGNDDNLGCSICTEDFELGQDLRVLPCDHKFHPECVDPWLLNVSGTCPLCRVDLRPVTTHDSANPEDLAATPEAEFSHRRRSAFRDILSLRQRPNASTEERIVALRRLREQRLNRSGDVATGSTNASAEDVGQTRDRRSKRMSLRNALQGRNRRERSNERSGEGSNSAQQPRDGSPDAGAGAGASTHERQ